MSEKYIVVRKNDFTLKGKIYQIKDIKKFESEYIFKDFNVRDWHYKYEIIFKDNTKISDYLHSTGIDDIKLEYVRHRFLGVKSADEIKCKKANWTLLYIVLFIDALIFLAIYYHIIFNIPALVLIFIILTFTPSVHYQLWFNNKPALVCKSVKFVFRRVEKNGYY
jgi:hypothetical protein